MTTFSRKECWGCEFKDAKKRCTEIPRNQTLVAQSAHGKPAQRVKAAKWHGLVVLSGTPVPV